MQSPISSTICRPADRDNLPHVQWEADDMTNNRFRLIDLIDDMRAGKDVFFQFVRAVKDIMPNNVKTLTLDDTVGKALQFMKQSDIRHVCVVDIPIGEEKKPYFVGVISERDIFRQIPPNIEKANGAKTNPKVQRQLLGQIVTRKPKTVSPETSIPNMLSVMLDNHVDMVPVLDGEDPVSVITTADVIKLIVRFETIYQLSAKPKETGHSPDKNTGESLAVVMESMKNGKFRHVPRGRCNGWNSVRSGCSALSSFRRRTASARNRCVSQQSFPC